MPSSFFGWVGYLAREYSGLFLRGTVNTLFIAILGTSLGFLLGLLVAVLRAIEPGPRTSAWKRVPLKILHGFLATYIEVFRGTPMIVQAMVIFYGTMSALNVSLPRMFAAILVITINTGAYMAEIIRGGIISIDKGQTEAAHSIGLTHWQTMVSVVLPQAIRNIMPSIGNEFIINIKDSSVLNVISVTELFFQAKSAAGTYYRYFETYFIVALIYLVLTFTVTRVLRYIERRMDGPDTYTVLGSQNDSRANFTVHKEA